MNTRSHSILFITLAAFCSMASMRISDPLLPVISAEFKIPTGSASAIVGAFAIAYGFSQFLFGPMADRLGKLYVIGWALFLSVLANIGVALSTDFDAIVWWRGVSGATTAGVVPLAMAWVGETVPYEERQPTLARFLFGVLGGTIGGQILGGLCADSSNWRIGFYGIAALYLASLVLLMASGSAKRAVRPADSGNTLGSQRHFRNVLSQRWSQFILFVVGVEGFLFYGAVVFIPAYLHLELRLSLTVAGVLMSGFGLGGLLYAGTARRMLARLGETGLVKGGGLFLGSSFMLLLVTGHWVFPAIAIFIMGLGLYMLHNTLQTHATQMTPESRGTAVSLFACSLFLGQSLGVSGAGWLIDRIGFVPLFWISATGLPLLAFWLSHYLKSHPVNQP
ncbi:MAG: MFS transporter [Burkholderiaceae bacterium]|nr:MFS transporter [Burkholderiaceae bacterium]